MKTDLQQMGQNYHVWSHLSQGADLNTRKAMEKDLLTLKADRYEHSTAKVYQTYLREESLFKAALRDYILNRHPEFINAKTAKLYADQKGGVEEFFNRTGGLPPDVTDLFTEALDKLENRDGNTGEAKDKITKDIFICECTFLGSKNS